MQQQDPVCGMTIDSTNAVGAAHGSQKFYFCSTACRDHFQSDPAQYLGASTTNSEDQRMERHEPPHTTKGGMTSPKFGSAGSGGAEYEPLPEQHDR